VADQSFIIELVLSGADGVRQGLQDAFKNGSISAEQFAALLKQVDAAADNLVGTLGRVGAAFTAMRAATADIAAAGGRVVTAWNQLESSAGRVVRNTTLLGASIAGAGTALVAFVASGVRAADALNDQATAAGLTVQRYQEVQFAAAQLGVSQTQLATGLNNFNRQVGDLVRDQSKSLLGFVETLGKIQLPPGVIRVQKGFTDTRKIIEEGATIMQACTLSY